MTTLIEFLVNELPKRGGWPKGAVEAYRHVSDDFPSFYDEDGGSVSREYGRSLNLCSVDLNLDDDELGETVTREQYEAALAASKPEWDGEGLPPVGTRCEFISNDSSWGEVDVIGIDGDKVVFKPSGETYYGIAPSQRQIFRPIRSEVDKKRDEAMRQLSHSLRAYGSVTEEQLNRLYNDIEAGFIPHIRID